MYKNMLNITTDTISHEGFLDSISKWWNSLGGNITIEITSSKYDVDAINTLIKKGSDLVNILNDSGLIFLNEAIKNKKSFKDSEKIMSDYLNTEYNKKLAKLKSIKVGNGPSSKTFHVNSIKTNNDFINKAFYDGPELISYIAGMTDDMFGGIFKSDTSKYDDLGVAASMFLDDNDDFDYDANGEEFDKAERYFETVQTKYSKIMFNDLRNMLKPYLDTIKIYVYQKGGNKDDKDCLTNDDLKKVYSSIYKEDFKKEKFKLK